MIQEKKRAYSKDTLKKTLYQDLRDWCKKPFTNETDEMIAEKMVSLITKYIDICEKRGRF